MIHSINTPYKGLLIFGTSRSGTTVMLKAIWQIMRHRHVNGLVPTYADEVFNHWRLYNRQWSSLDYPDRHGTATICMTPELENAIVQSRLDQLFGDISGSVLWPLMKIHSQEMLAPLLLPRVMDFTMNKQLYRILMMRWDVRNLLASKVLHSYTAYAHITHDDHRGEYEKIIDELRLNPRQLVEADLQYHMRDIVAHLHAYLSWQHRFDQIIWYDQIEKEAYPGIPALDISADDMLAVMSNHVQSQKMHVRAQDTLRQCVINWDLFEDACVLLEDIRNKVGSLIFSN